MDNLKKSSESLEIYIFVVFKIIFNNTKKSFLAFLKCVYTKLLPLDRYGSHLNLFKNLQIILKTLLNSYVYSLTSTAFVGLSPDR